MRPLVVTDNITLDGVIDAEEGWFDPAGEDAEDSSDVEEVLSTGGEIGVTGSIQLVHELVAQGLVDEYRLFVHPVVLGHGDGCSRTGGRCQG